MKKPDNFSLQFIKRKQKVVQLKKKLRIALVQINNSFSGQNYLPYSIACLKGYVEKNATHPDNYEFLPFIYKREAIKKIIEKIKDADLVGFSTYVWNIEISLEIARRLKKINKKINIIFGGPHVPDQPKDFLNTNKFIDLAVHNEGEKTFLNILESYPSNDWENISGISFINKSDKFIKTTPVNRFNNLEEVPSPFLNGIFDHLINENPNEKWIGLWETNRGCPFQCTFCDWGSATAAKISKFEMQRLDNEINWFAEKKIEYIFVCDANFGIQKRDVDIAEKVAKVRNSLGYPHGFSVQNTKNATERAYLTQKILSDAGLNKGVALSMQSLDETTLKNIKRDNISLETYLELSKRFTKDNVETYSDLILGLPGETYESFIKGVEKLVISGQHNRIQFNNLSILPNAEMGQIEYLNKFKMEIIKSKIINIHGSKEEIDDDVQEMQDLVISTYSLSKENWQKTRVFSWASAFLYFDKLFQIPLMILIFNSNSKFHKLIELFINPDELKFPVLAKISNFFHKEANSIQNGGEEYVFSEKWLGIYWPADEYIYIWLTVEHLLDSFYDEAEKLIISYLELEQIKFDRVLLADTIRLNKALVSQPFVKKNLNLDVSFNILEFFNSKKCGQICTLKKGKYSYEIIRSNRYYDNLNDWLREIVWWGNKKGAYLYNNNFIQNEPEISGHY